jgi:hypothetical protein
VGAVGGLLVTLTVGYAAGGDGLVAHWLTRALMARVGILPLRLTRFLDLTVDRMLRIQADGGHAFVHRLLLEHFAGLEPSDARASYPPVVDLRPHVPLDRAMAEVQDRPDVAVALLSYTIDVLPAEVWARGRFASPTPWSSA